MLRIIRDFRVRNSQLLVTCIYLALLVFGCKFPEEVERIGYLILVMTASFAAEARVRTARHIALFLAVVLFVLASLFARDIYYDAALLLISLGILVHSAGSVIYFLTKSETISENEILGLVNCYIIMGFIWAFIYAFVEAFQPGSFSYRQSGELLVDVFIYFSFSTLTTVGFGDITPATDFAQRLCIVEAMAGQFYFALVVAYLLSKYADRRSHRGKGQGSRDGGGDPGR